MLTTLLLASVFGPVKTLSSTIEPMSIDRFLGRLSRDTRIDLTAKGEVGRDVLTMCVKDAPFDEVLGRIAHVTYGTWSHSRGGLVLERSADAVQEATKAREAHSEAAFIKDLKPFINALAENYDAAHIGKVCEARDVIKANLPPNSREPLLPFDYEDPLMRALGRLLVSIDPLQIGRLHIGEQLVLSTEPDASRAVVPFREDVRRILRELGEEQDLWSRVQLSRPGADSADWTADRNDEFFHGGDFSAELSQFPWTRAKPFRARPTSATLWISEIRFGEFNCDLQFSGPLHKPVVGMQWWVGPAGALHPDSHPPSDLVPLRPESIALDMPESIRMERMFRGSAPLQAHFPYSPTLEPWIKDLVRHDPLSLLFPEALEGLAKERKCNLVADLSDASMECVQQAKHDNSVSPEEMLEFIRNSGDMEAESDPDWITIRPTDLEETGATRPDLRTVSAVLGRLQRTGRLRASDYIDIARACPTSSSRAPALFAFLSHLTGDRIGRFQDWSLLRLLSSLSSEQRNVLLSGGRIPFSAFPPDTLADLRLPSRWFDSSVVSAKEQPSKPGITATLASERVVDLIDSLHPDGAYWWITVPSPPSLARVHMGPPLPVPAKGLDGTLCLIHSRERLTITVEESPGDSKVFTLICGESSAAGPPLPFAKLPEKLRRAVKEEYDWIRKEPVSR